ncbi:winged helix-turn-helix domain-containing protein [Desulfotruncus alcoholivorax]|uniref:winged helix-turn-helix domain-containing protein n=1 Tax=Desulfotruncus alcoholivorax TaxID=265477 RepID=UPI000423791B|nr:LysR family transcriptional regulator [Desulfotruncus alcoholivorax]
MTADNRDINKNAPFAPGYKVWLQKGDGVIGDGFFKLLELIQHTGTITGAASAMGMSYRAAWGKIKLVEKKCGIELVTTVVGGEAGGGAMLTPEAIDLMQKFLRFRKSVDIEVQKLFKQNFSN